MYIVYIRVVHNRQSSFIRTQWMVNDVGVNSKNKEVTAPFVIQQASVLMSQYYHMLNQIDCSSWTATEVASYLTKVNEEISFSDYVRKHVDHLIATGHERIKTLIT
mgnify:FL=1